MKEKDIVDFTKLKKNENGNYIDEEGNEIGCEICYTHENAYKKFEYLDKHKTRVINPICPKCGNIMINYARGYEEAIVTEQNSSVPDGEIGYYSVFTCENCENNDDGFNQHVYALMPQRIAYNGNHDIFYTGGRKFIEDEIQQKLVDGIYAKIKPSMEQFAERIIKEHDNSLDTWNILGWTKSDVEGAVANWLYENGLKK